MVSTSESAVPLTRSSSHADASTAAAIANDEQARHTAHAHGTWHTLHGTWHAATVASSEPAICAHIACGLEFVV